MDATSTPGAGDGKPDDAAKKPEAKRFDATLPLARTGRPRHAKPAQSPDGELDLDVGDIQTRLPYGSEDIADK